MTKYQSLISKFTNEELEIIAQLKRFFERVHCDRELMDASAQNNISPGQLDRLKKTGITLDLSGFPLASEDQQNAMLYLMTASGKVENEFDDEVKQFAEKYPLLKLWGKYLAINSEERKRTIQNKKDGGVSFNAKFDAWRKRRITAAKSELGFYSMQISHPAFAYELSEGCSVGCWFCSFAPHKLTGVLDYDNRRGNVQRIIKYCIDIFGKETAGNALPYYRTEPHDNPGYIQFLQDFEELTGSVVCTSTAVCGDIDWLRDLMDYYRRGDIRYNWPRLSILSLSMMDKVHEAFTPIELLDIELLVQAKDNVRPKVTSGHILEEHTGLRDMEDFTDKDNIGYVPRGSIVCVSGFNINLLTNTIMLFSPCYTTKEWPHGFRVYGQATYNDESDFPEVIKRLIDETMFLAPPKDKLIRFRDDIVFRPTEEGFDLATPNQLHHFKGKDKYGPLGLMVSSGEYTCGELVMELTKKQKTNPLILRAIIQSLFDDGFLDEIYSQAVCDLNITKEMDF